MNDHTDATASDDRGRDLRPVVDAAIERLVASMPLRRPSALLDARINALLEQREQPWWQRMAPIAAAAGFALAIGFVAGSWMSQARLNGGSMPSGIASGSASDGLELVLRDSSVRPAALATPRSVDLGDEGAVQTADSLWIRTDRFHDPRRGVTIERS